MMSHAATAEVNKDGGVGTSERQAELHLLSSVLRGNMDARRCFFLRYTQVIEARVRQILRRGRAWVSEDDVQDMVSEIWLSLFEDDMRSLRRFDPDRQIKVATWVGLLARNKTIDKLRTSHTGRMVSMDDGTVAREPACSKPLPAEEVERSERRALAVQAMEQLSGEERRFMEAWYVDDRPPEELADEFGIAVGTVYSRRFKIQAKLARAINSLNKPRRRATVTPRTIH